MGRLDSSIDNLFGVTPSGGRGGLAPVLPGVVHPGANGRAGDAEVPHLIGGDDDTCSTALRTAGRSLVASAQFRKSLPPSLSFAPCHDLRRHYLVLHALQQCAHF